MPSPIYRTHEWLADRISWVQYPKRPAPRPRSVPSEPGRLDRRARRITGAIFFAVVVLPFLGGAIAGLLQPRPAPAAPGEPRHNDAGKPVLKVLAHPDRSWA